MIMIRKILLSLLVCLYGCSGAMAGILDAPPLRQASEADILTYSRLAAWGDSLTAGTGGTAWPQQFSANKGWAYYNGGIGGQSSTQIRDRMLADNAKSGWPTVIWAGRNNFTDPTTVKADIASMVASLGHTRYLVLGITSGFGGSENIGTPNGLIIAGLNSDLAALYGSRFVDALAALVAAYNPGIPQDVTDHNNGIPPSSLRSDAVHLNTAGYGIIAAAVATKEAILFPQSAAAVTTRRLGTLFDSPPDIGRVTPNTGAFSRIGVNQPVPLSGFSITDVPFNIAGTAPITWSGTTLAITKSGDGNSLVLRGGLLPFGNGNGVIGNNANRWFNGFFSNALLSPNFQGHLSSGTNASGLPVAITGGTSTGSASGGTIDLQVTPPGSSGAALNLPVVVGRFDVSTTAGDTRFLLWDVTAGSLKRVSIGSVDSGGSGFKVLRVPN